MTLWVDGGVKSWDDFLGNVFFLKTRVDDLLDDNCSTIVRGPARWGATGYFRLGKGKTFRASLTGISAGEKL